MYEQPSSARTSRVPDGGALVVRATRLSDAEEIAAISNLPGYRWGTFRLPYTSLEDVRKLLESRPAGNLGLVATRDDRVVGARWARALHRPAISCRLLGMGVHDDHVGTGVGKALLQAVIDTAENWIGLRRIELTVYVDNEPALALYRRHDFEVEGMLKALPSAMAHSWTPMPWHAQSVTIDPLRLAGAVRRT